MRIEPLDSDEAITGINVTPLVDITLVLLIIFMVTTSYIVNPSIKVDLPRAKTGQQTDRGTVSLLLDREGTLHLNGRRVTPAEVRRRVAAALRENADLQAVISADRRLRYERVVWLIDLVKQLGVRRYALNVRFDAERR